MDKRILKTKKKVGSFGKISSKYYDFGPH